MKRIAFVLFGAMLLGAAAFGQTKKWTLPRTSDGKPDLQGIWTNATITPLERPPELAGKSHFTPAEAAEYERRWAIENNIDNRNISRDRDVALAYNGAWWDRGSKVVKTLQTSLIVDPPDGRIPPLTPAAQKRADEIRAYNQAHPADGPENRSLTERCLVWPTLGPPMLPSAYNNNYQIFQTPGYVVIEVEMIHDVRVIPVAENKAAMQPHLPANIRQWKGDSRGYWEGNTLVVDTTNFTDKTRFRGSGPKMHLIERFTRTDEDTLVYEFTVDDPESFTRPWSAAVPMNKAPGPLFEYACHEGNYGMEGILRGARAEEQEAAGKAAGK
jgi:hypothetical protein